MSASLPNAEKGPVRLSKGPATEHPTTKKEKKKKSDAGKLYMCRAHCAFYTSKQELLTHLEVVHGASAATSDLYECTPLRFEAPGAARRAISKITKAVQTLGHRGGRV